MQPQVALEGQKFASDLTCLLSCVLVWLADLQRIVTPGVTPELFPALEEFSSSEDSEVVCLCTLCPAVLLLLLEAFPSAFHVC